MNQGQVPTCGHNSCGMVLNAIGKEFDIGALVQRVPPPSEKGVFTQNVAGLTRCTSNGISVAVRIAGKTRGSDLSHL